ncbi:DNA helicase [Lachnospiraceae bacterium]|nr:DNA helicase [Lachnospiraceae bacterium]BDF38388.1 DNA helicase [Lachnospiraceae bacterium]
MGLNSAQNEAVAHHDGPCMVLAGPGSGKTLTIAKRIEYLIQKHKVRPEEILVITFTKYASNEMRKRFLAVMGEQLPVTFGTFHGIYYGILKWALRIGQDNLLTDEERYQLLRQIISESDMDGIRTEEEEKDYLKDLSTEIGRIKNDRLDIHTYESARFGKERFRTIYCDYEAAKKKWNKIDFEDMLLLCFQLFLKRPDILEKWQQKFRYILVDEFQDINQVQYDVLRMLAAPEDNLFVVGDDDQSIYGFRGARPGIMAEFKKDYPDARQVLLDVNYRSTSHIVNGALRVIGHNQNRFKKTVHSDRKPGETVHVQEVKDSVEEGRYVVEQIRKLNGRGIPYSQLAVLYRTALDARALSESLMEYHIPFTMKEHMDNIYDHFIARDIASYFHLVLKEYDRRYFLQIANRPNRYIGRDSMSEEPVTYESLRRFYCDKDWMMNRIDQLEWDIKMMENKPPYLAIQYMRKSIGYDEFLKEYAAYRQISVQELYQVLDEIQELSRGFETMDGWFAHVEQYKMMLREQRKKNADAGESVSLMTMHGSKGLEYDTVFIIQGNEGIVPYKKAKTEDEVEEERRLFYVAMTRAKRKLIISYVKEKNGKEANPSRFVNELFLAV